MRDRPSDNPSVNKTITLTTYKFTATGKDGFVTLVNADQLERGQSIILVISGGTAQGFTTTNEYFVIPVDGTHIALASTKANALSGVTITTTGDAGAGTVYPNYEVNGVLWVGTGGDLNVRGKRSSVFSVCTNAADGSIFPMYIKDISSYNTTASELVAWGD